MKSLEGGRIRYLLPNYGYQFIGREFIHVRKKQKQKGDLRGKFEMMKMMMIVDDVRVFLMFTACYFILLLPMAKARSEQFLKDLLTYLKAC